MDLYIIDESKLFHRLNANKLLVFFGDVLTITERRKDVLFPKTPLHKNATHGKTFIPVL